MNTAPGVNVSLCKEKVFLFIVGIYLLFLLVMLVGLGYEDSFLALNSRHQNWLDLPMFILTHIGDSLILSSLIVLLFVRKYPEVVLTTITIIILTGIFGQLLKVSFFNGWDRPLKVFNESPLIYVLPNYKLFHNSFPSGHSITISAGLTALVLGFKPNKVIQILAAMTIIVVSYTRIYLGIHFPGDVLAGCLVGMVVTLILTPYLTLTFSRFSYTSSFKLVLTFVSIVTFITGIWFLKDYFLS